MSIFKDEDAAIENTRESAKNLGHNVPKLVKKKIRIANPKCKECRGKGYITWSFPGNNGSGESQNFYCRCISEKVVEVPE